jgi:outer membrane immunogenic protein
MAMRWVFWALVVLSFAPPAAAANLDLGVPAGPLTVGPATFTRWSGFYFGGQVGWGNANADFSGATKSLVAFALRNTLLESEVAPSQWQVLGNANQSAAAYGGFVGYNTQWQDLILGMEANFNRASFSLHASTSPIGRTTSDSAGNAYIVNITGSGSIVMQDFATMRLRA